MFDDELALVLSENDRRQFLIGKVAQPCQSAAEFGTGLRDRLALFPSQLPRQVIGTLGDPVGELGQVRGSRRLIEASRF